MQLYRGSQKLKALSLNESSSFRQSLLSEDIVECHFSSYEHFAFEIGDYLMHRGRRFSLLGLPSVNKISSVHYDFHLMFYGSQYRLSHVLYSLDGNAEFPLRCDAPKALELLAMNLQRAFPQENWSVGERPPPQSSRAFPFAMRTALAPCKRFARSSPWSSI